MGKVAYGAITGAAGSAVQEVLLSTDAAAPTGWTLAWTYRVPGDVQLPITIGCGNENYFVPELRKAGESPIRGAEITARPPCTVDTPSFVSGSISGSTVTINYSLPGPAAPGVTIMAAYKLSGIPGKDISTPLGTPPAGGSSGTGSFNAPGLMPPMGAYVRLYAVNGPVESSLTGQNRVNGELPVLNDYTTTVTGVAGESSPKTTAAPMPGNFTPQSATRASFLYKLAPGSTLPAGLKVDQLTGVVKGNGGTLAAGSGSAMIVLQSFDGQRSSNAARVDYAIAPAPPAPGQVTYPDVQAVVGTAVSVQPVKGSGTSGYYYSKNLCTQFPGLALDNATGRITGTPTAPSTQASVDVTIAKSPGTACGDPVGAFVARTQVRIQVDLAPQQFAIVYPQSTITALIGSPIAAGAPNVLPAGTSVDTFTVSSGVLPAGVALDKATGAISGTATALANASTVTVTAADTQANRSATADITFTILPTPGGAQAGLAYPSVASAPIGVPVAVVPTGKVTGQTFALDAASLAAGMAIDATTGKITWVPKAPVGARTVTVTVSAGGTSAPLTPFTITVTPAPATSVSGGAAGAASSAGASTGGAGGSSGSTGARSGVSACLAPNGTLYSDLQGSVGSTLTMASNTLGMPAAKSFTVTNGSLPPGVDLDGTFGVISGTPVRATTGNGAVEVTATWPDGTVRVSDFTIAVDDPHHAINYPNRIIGSIGQGLTVTPLPINTVGATRFQVVCGAVPAGMTLNPTTGVISGTPTTLDERPMPLRVRMTDTYGWVDTSFIIVVNPGVTPWLRYPEFAELGYGTKAVITPTRSGLPAGGTYAIDGALPPGLAFDTRTGIISGV
ncbi:MAG: putative Ig domain-containing protein, partial [Candidatus Nanopelagicales bacterium]|nr:putative Ig domain-containing protein [Candidatus Nanopelagicales bacterium]